MLQCSVFKDTLKQVKFVAGNGGDGVVRFDIERRPTGGDGGHGGSVYLEGTTNVYDLNSIRSDLVYRAENGDLGAENQKTGKTGKDIVVLVPLTTEVYNEDDQLVLKISENNERKQLLKGGAAGNGNYYYKAGQFETLNKSTKGKPGGTLTATLILKLKADIIFIGLPNAGKSSLLNHLTNAKAKIGAYPFTTIIPQLGRMGDITLMDLPGLVEGTATGRGVGPHFLKHTEYARLVAHCISLESDDPEADYEEIRKEMKALSAELFAKPEVIVLTKSDAVSKEKVKGVIGLFEKKGLPVLACSIQDDDSIQAMRSFLAQHLPATPVPSEEEQMVQAEPAVSPSELPVEA